MSKTFNVLFASAEVSPLAKVGGLADVVGALPTALEHHDITVRIIMPKYDVIDGKEFPMKLITEKLTVKLGAGDEMVDLYTTTLPHSKVIVYLIDAPKYFGHGSVYFEKKVFVEGLSEVDRFAFFSKAVVDLLPSLDWPVRIVHCHDWHTGLMPALLKIKATGDKKAAIPKTAFTIHNLGNQGKWTAMDIFKFLGLDDQSSPSFSLINEYGDLNLMEQGIVAADVVNTVSPTYAQEILTPTYGAGLQDQLQKRQDEGKLYGILNGIDIDRFNPSNDPALVEKYSLKDPAGKAANKESLQQWAGLTVDESIPVIGFIGRLIDQKGFDLIPPIADELFKRDVQLIILGTGIKNHESFARQLASDFPDKVRVEIGFDAKLAQLIYSGSDMFLMPSRFEPCGLGQMIAMRYGTPPIVRATGGLSDTVNDVKDADGTGFVFARPESLELLSAIERAMELFGNKQQWRQLIQNNMRQDFSWNHSSRQYVKMYQSLVQ